MATHSQYYGDNKNNLPGIETGTSAFSQLFH
jgi:hypothetical protein